MFVSRGREGRERRLALIGPYTVYRIISFGKAIVEIKGKVFFSDAVSAIDTSRRVGDEKHASDIISATKAENVSRSMKKKKAAIQTTMIQRGITAFRSARLCNFSLGPISFPPMLTTLTFRDWQTMALRDMINNFLLFLFSFSSLFASLAVAITACYGNN